MSKQLSVSKATVSRVIKKVAATDSIEKLSRKHERIPSKITPRVVRLNRREVYKNLTISSTKKQETLRQHTIYVWCARWIRKLLQTKFALRSFRPAKDGRQIDKRCSGVTRAASKSFHVWVLCQTPERRTILQAIRKTFPFNKGLGFYGKRRKGFIGIVAPRVDYGQSKVHKFVGEGIRSKHG